MAGALVSLVVEQLGSLVVRELEQEVRLVVGVKKEVDKLTSNLTAIQAVLDDAETRQVKEATVRDWLEKLKDVAYDIEDVLDDWEAAILSSQSKSGDEQVDPKPEKKVCSFLRSSCFCCKQVDLRHDIAYKIIELNRRLDLLAREKDCYRFVSTEANQPIERSMTVSMIDITEVKGRDEVKNVLVNMLLSESPVGDRPDLPVISIVGMGGIGKTTLAQFAFNHNNIEAYFDKKIWICVSDPFDETSVAKTILVSLLDSTPVTTELEYLMQKIGESIKEKKILLILDDVWEENPRKWDKLRQPLRFASRGSKVLVTTRKGDVASVMGCSKDNILNLESLSDEECWLILSKIALFDRSDVECRRLEEIGRKISGKCRGLPLAAKTLGSALRFRKTREEWQQILDSDIWKVEETHRDVIAPLWLSYYDLSPALKRCFSYCAIFPKDYEIKRTELIGLWMAQGYLKKRQNDNLEIIGENYFQNLAMRSFFQDFKKDEVDDQIIHSCKMHDIVHDLAQIIAQNECLAMQVNSPLESTIKSLSGKLRHLSLNFAKSGSSFKSFEGAKKFRSLLLWAPPYALGPLTTTEELSRLLSELTHGRSLSISDNELKEIPSSIGKLVHLRWLDLSHNRKLKKLPKTLCELHNLQTIDVSWCRDLELPPGIGKLINLRHLCNCGGPSSLPKGIARLTGLRTLQEVDVGFDHGDTFSLGDLKNLNQLRGSLVIRNLGAHNGHVGEAKEAEIKKKEHLTRLELEFQYREGEGEDKHLLEALEPSPNLEILLIDQYKGTTFPGWMINSLTNLRSLKLIDCHSCKQLPSLGKLPSLETLALSGLSSVKKVGVELLGIETPQIGGTPSSSSSSSPLVVAFPKLTKLKFKRLHFWEEWDDYYCDNDGTTKALPAIIIMPSLLSLEITDCKELKALPDYMLENKKLHTLRITNGNHLKQRYNKENREDWSKISHIPHVKISSVHFDSDDETWPNGQKKVEKFLADLYAM